MTALGAYLGQSIGEEIDKIVAAGRARQVGVVSAVPAGIPIVTLDELLRRFSPWYKKWWIWAGAGVVLAGGTYFALRRRRA